MYKNRYFLMGLGIGFILCGILLILSSGDLISIYSTPDNFTSEKLTVEELKMIADEKNLYLYTEEELNEIIKNSTKIDDDIPENIDELPYNNEEDIENDANSKIFKFRISYGLDSYEVADYLFSVGVLKDKQLFQKILKDNNLTKMIISGDYETKDLTVEELIELITRTNIEN